MVAELTYREGLPGPRDRRARRRLLLDIFDVDISPIDEFGLADPTYRAFSYLDATGCCIANAATFTLPLIIGDKRVHAAGIQSVATRPEWRRRGLSHDLLERALRWCDKHARLTFLMTAIPRFYEPMGFRAATSEQAALAWTGGFEVPADASEGMPRGHDAARSIGLYDAAPGPLGAAGMSSQRPVSAGRRMMDMAGSKLSGHRFSHVPSILDSQKRLSEIFTPRTMAR